MMKCRMCTEGVLESIHLDPTGETQTLVFSCGHQATKYDREIHDDGGSRQCSWCGRYLPTFRQEWLHGLAGPICGSEGCLDMDSWLGETDDQSQAILDATQDLVDEMAQGGLLEPPEVPEYIRRLFPLPEATGDAPGPGTDQDPPRLHTFHQAGRGTRCEASTIKGDPCSNYTQAGSLFCGVHRDTWEAVE